MARRGNGGTKPKKRKKVTVQLIKEKHAGEVTEPYRLLSEIRTKNHAHLAEAKIGLAWRLGWRSDTDGHLKLGQCRKRGDLDRELDSFDFVILLNKEAWNALNDKQKRAVIDHELCHAQIVIDADGQPKYNDRDRLVCRTRKHDVEEFKAVVDRHGLWTHDLEAIAKAGINDAKRPLLAVAEAAGKAADKPKEKEAARGNGQAAAPANDAWKKLSISELHLSDKLDKILQDADLDTLGKFSAYMAKGDFWAQDLKGVGPQARSIIEAAWESFWSRHPEFCQK